MNSNDQFPDLESAIRAYEVSDDLETQAAALQYITQHLLA